MLKKFSTIAKENNEDEYIIRSRAKTLFIPVVNLGVKMIDEKYIPYLLINPTYRELIDTALTWFYRFNDEGMEFEAEEALRKMNKFEIIRFLIRKQII